MNPERVIKTGVDATMYIVFLLLMGQYLLPGLPHEWLGIVAGVLFILHNLLNYKWYRALFKGKYNGMRILQTAVNFLLLITVFTGMVSGILASQHLFSIGDGGTIELGRFLHLVATAWSFLLMSVHLGLHWVRFAGITKKLPVSRNGSHILRRCFQILAVVLCIYGIYIFIERQFWEELFHLIDYQKEYDTSKTFFVYLAESIVMSAMLIVVTYYMKKYPLHRKMQKRKEIR